MTPEIERDHVNRLTLVRHIHRQGERFAGQRVQQAVVAVLMYHDAVDLWLQIAAERMEAAVKHGKTYFLNYLSIIDEKLNEQGQQLAHASQMKKLNTARNAFKHGGLVPDAKEIETFKVYVRDFLDENTTSIFGLSFQDLSFVDLIEDEDHRRLLAKAARSLAEGRPNLAGVYASTVMPHLIMGSVPDESDRSLTYRLIGKSRGELEEGDGEELLAAFDSLEGKHKYVSWRVSRLETEVALLSHGINLQEHRRFLRTATVVEWSRVPPAEGAQALPEGDLEELPDGSIEPVYYDEDGDILEFLELMKPVTEQEARFMVDFVIDCALRKQEADAIANAGRRESDSDLLASLSSE